MEKTFAITIAILCFGCADPFDQPPADAGPADAAADTTEEAPACCPNDAISTGNAACATPACAPDGGCLILPARAGTLCGGDPDASTEWAECTGCGSCAWSNYGNQDPCGGVADTKPCRNGRGLCYNGVCVPFEACH